jgi:ATP-binding cassette subfamily G (WHITE) protein 2 (SNQ2)
MASRQEHPTPLDSDIPGGWIETPADPSRHQSYIGSQYNTEDGATSHLNTEDVPTPRATEPSHNAYGTSSGSFYGSTGAGLFSESSPSTAVPSPEAQPTSNTAQGGSLPTEDDAVIQNKNAVLPSLDQKPCREEIVEEPVEKLEQVASDSSSSDNEHEDGYAAIKPAEAAAVRPHLQSKKSQPITEEDLFRTLSRRRTSQAGLSKSNTNATGTGNQEDDEINNLMSKMFGRTRQEHSEEEKTRHQGVIFKHLTGTKILGTKWVECPNAIP